MKKKKGQALIEIALALPILILFFCGIVDFGRILHAAASLEMVAQESVRLAGLGRDDSEVTQFALDKSDINDKASINVAITPSYSQRKAGDYVTVNITYPIKYITPVINTILPSPFVVSTKSTIRVE
jgi:Flp pilus assembly protein TadG